MVKIVLSMCLQTIFPHNSEATNRTNWESWPKSKHPDQLSMAYEVQFELQYEPVYVADNRVPAFDERFQGYGDTRWTQAYETYVAGYSFRVLDDAFLVHWGFQYAGRKPQWREDQQKANHWRLRGFGEDLKLKYGKDPLDLFSFALSSETLMRNSSRIGV
ncbi:unnamed protein product, partial [Notodromas monacha]